MGKVKKEMNLEDIKELLEVYSEPPADKRTPYIVYRNLIEQGPEFSSLRHLHNIV